MKSKWRVMAVDVAGRTFYQAYRLLDLCAENTRKNRETQGGYYQTEKEAQNIADLLNAEGK
jgi:hypothetical protein